MNRSIFLALVMCISTFGVSAKSEDMNKYQMLIFCSGVGATCVTVDSLDKVFLKNWHLKNRFGVGIFVSMLGLAASHYIADHSDFE